MTNLEQGSSLANILAQLGDLRATVARQEQTIAALQQQLEGRDDALSTPGIVTQPEPETPACEAPAQPSRRTLLKVAGAAAAVVAAAGAVSVSHIPEVSASAVPLNVDSLNTGQSVTELNTTATTISEPSYATATGLFVSDASSTTSYSYTSGGTTTTVKNGLPGIYGVGGANGSTGVAGYASGPSAAGVEGLTDYGFGVAGHSTYGIDIASLGTGRQYQYPQSTAGAPTAGNYLQGEQVRDSQGELWLCTASGSPGTWVRAAHAQPNYTGGALNFFAAPIRVIDTRAGQNPPAPLPATKAPLASGSTTTFQITGTAVGGVSVPSGAVGVYANVTVVFPTNGGNLIFYPTGASVPSASTINYNPGTQVVGNFTIVGLSAAGQFSVVVNGPGSTDVVVDIAGFIL